MPEAEAANPKSQTAASQGDSRDSTGFCAFKRMKHPVATLASGVAMQRIAAPLTEKLDSGQ